jgi:hypothetical protein
MTRAHGPKDFGEGPLSLIAAFVYTLLVVEVMLVVAGLPTLVLYFLFARDILVGALCAIPLGPALSAAVHALHHRRADITNLNPARQFWHGYRINWRAVLPPWLIGVAWLAIIGLILLNFGTSGVPLWWGGLLALVSVAVLLWLTNALIISSLFTFRTRDLLQLAWEMLARTPVVALGNFGVLAAAIALAIFAAEAVVVALGSLLVLVLVTTSRPMIEYVTAEFTEPSSTT